MAIADTLVEFLTLFFMECKKINDCLKFLGMLPNGMDPRKHYRGDDIKNLPPSTEESVKLDKFKAH